VLPIHVSKTIHSQIVITSWWFWEFSIFGNNNVDLYMFTNYMTDGSPYTRKNLRIGRLLIRVRNITFSQWRSEILWNWSSVYTRFIDWLFVWLMKLIQRDVIILFLIKSRVCLFSHSWTSLCPSYLNFKQLVPLLPHCSLNLTTVPHFITIFQILSQFVCSSFPIFSLVLLLKALNRLTSLLFSNLYRPLQA